MESERQTRKRRIDPLLKGLGWKVVPFDEQLSLAGLSNCAIEEFPTDNGPADYALCVDGRILGVIEAKKLTLGPQNVLTQAQRYARGLTSSLLKQTGTDLTDHYVDVLRTLGKQPGLLGDIFAGAQSRFNNPVNLKRMLTLIDETQWTDLDIDVKAEAFEGLLEKAASEGKKGAGQYFTPRVLIKSAFTVQDARQHQYSVFGEGIRPVLDMLPAL